MTRIPTDLQDASIALFRKCEAMGVAAVRLQEAKAAGHCEVMQRACEEVARASLDCQIISKDLERRLAVFRRRKPQVKA